MKCALLCSGGKDSWLAAWHASQSGLSLGLAVTFSPSKPDSFMFHGVNSKWAGEQAKLAGVKHMQVQASGEKEGDEAGLLKLFHILARKKFRGVVTGAIESEYQRERIERACDEAGLVHFAPLWHKAQEGLLSELLESGHDAVVVAVAADGMGKEWLGRKISGCKEELLGLGRRRFISPMGEGGEFETFCVKSPLFRKQIKIEKSFAHFSGSSGFLEIKGLSFR